MALNTTASLPALTPAIYYKQTLLKLFDVNTVFYKLGTKTTLPKNSGKRVTWQKSAVLSVSTTPLVSGTPPTDRSLTITDVYADVSQYGDVVKMTDFLESTSIQKVGKLASERLGKQAALTIDTIIRDELDGTLPNQFASGATTLAGVGNTEVLNAKEILKALITLQDSSVGPHSSDGYVLVLAPKCKGDLMNDTADGSWLDVQKYIDPSSKRPITGDCGKLFDTRIIMSANISSTTTDTKNSERVYSNIFLGEECYGVVDLGGTNIQMFNKPLGSAGSLDPINQIASMGWKSPGFAAKNLGGSPDRGLRIRAGSSY